MAVASRRKRPALKVAATLAEVSPASLRTAKAYLQTTRGTLYVGDARLILPTLGEETIDCIIGSPPYYSVRDYGVSGQIGLEKSIDEYIESLCGVYDLALRTLKRTGSCWVVIGDLYVEKDLALLPARFALEMKRRSWILRNDVIWKKTRCLPHPVKDRLINTHEHIFHFVRDSSYYYDLDSIRLPHAPSSLSRIKSRIRVGAKGRYGDDPGNRGRTIDFLDENSAVHPKGRNPGDVFEACPSNAADGHLATYPQELIEPRIRSTCPPGGAVLDFWMGSGTTALVAERMNRRWVGIELNPTYCAIARKLLARPIQPELLG